MHAQRYMSTYGVTNEDFGRIAVVDRKHAATNPDAWFYQRPITLEDHQNSRWIVEPVLRLLDCCQESDGGVALVITSAERARDLRQPPAVIAAAAQGAAHNGEMMTSYYRDDITGLPEMGVVARQLWRDSGLKPQDIQTAFIYDHFTPFVFTQLEELGFCGRGEAKDFATVERLSLGGELPDQHQRRPARRGLHPRHERHHRGGAPGARHLPQPGRQRRARAGHVRHRRAHQRSDSRTGRLRGPIMPKLALLTAHGGPIELAEFPLTTPAPGTAALRLRMAGICGSDLHIFRGELPLPCPFAMGHEMVGEIAELGEGLTTDATGQPLAVGDRVVAPYFWFCGSCHACARGRSYACQNLMAGEYRTHEQAPHFVAALRRVLLHQPPTAAVQGSRGPARRGRRAAELRSGPGAFRAARCAAGGHRRHPGRGRAGHQRRGRRADSGRRRGHRHRQDRRTTRRRL